MNEWKKRGLSSFVAGLLGFAVVPLCSADSSVGPVSFNEDLLRAWWSNQPVLLCPETSTPDSAATSLHQHPASTLSEGVHFDQPLTVLRYVLSCAPEDALVLPTERYYYYSFDLGHRRVSGNLRFTDIENGIVHIGYFDIYGDPRDIRTGSFKDGQSVSVEYTSLDEPITIESDGVSSRFHINTRSLDQSDGIELSDGEEYVSGILDESGHSLSLIYYRPERMFYYVRSKGEPSPETLVGINSPAGHMFFVGQRTRFVFFSDPSTNREILVGVLARNISDNNYFDGPFDQVPPRLPIKEKLEAAYPYVKLRSGIDDHGNFRDGSASRVAISAYQSYTSIDALLVGLDALFRPFEEGPSQWCMLCYEPKRDFHRQLEVDQQGPLATPAERDLGSLYVHSLGLSKAWPANHWAEMSRQWVDHALETSLLWPRNHHPDESAER